MLVNVAPPTHDFHAIARYLVSGKHHPPHPDRVAWISTQNLPVDSPDLAATLMTATASLSSRCQRAAYHAMIAWAPDEQPTPTAMRDIAHETLRLAGLGEHQALIMGHGDTQHPHLHMLVNRINPSTGLAWQTSHDYALFDRIMCQLAGQHGFRYQPAHRYNREETDHLPKQPAKRARYAAHRGANTDRTQWSRKQSRQFGSRLSERLDQAAGWQDVVTAFEEHGLVLEEKGSGLVAGTAESYTTFSALNLNWSAKEFEKRFRVPFSAFAQRSRQTQRHWFDMDDVDLVRAFVRFGLAEQADVGRAIDSKRRLREQLRTTAYLWSFDFTYANTSLTRQTLPIEARPRRSSQRAARTGGR